MDADRDAQLVKLARQLERRLARRRALHRLVARVELDIRELRKFIRDMSSERPARRRPGRAPVVEKRP